jgi:hypothetical protein
MSNQSSLESRIAISPWVEKKGLWYKFFEKYGPAVLDLFRNPNFGDTLENLVEHAKTGRPAVLAIMQHSYYFDSLEFGARAAHILKEYSPNYAAIRFVTTHHLCLGWKKYKMNLDSKNTKWVKGKLPASVSSCAFKSAGSFPINIDNYDQKLIRVEGGLLNFLDFSVYLLKKHQDVAIFPEGEIVNGNCIKPKKGAVLIYLEALYRHNLDKFGKEEVFRTQTYEVPYDLICVGLSYEHRQEKWHKGRLGIYVDRPLHIDPEIITGYIKARNNGENVGRAINKAHKLMIERFGAYGSIGVLAEAEKLANL